MAQQSIREPSATIKVKWDIVIVVVTNLLVIGYNYGTIRAELKAINARLDRFERYQDDRARYYEFQNSIQSTQKNSNKSLIGVGTAAADTIGKQNGSGNEERPTERR